MTVVRCDYCGKVVSMGEYSEKEDKMVCLNCSREKFRESVKPFFYLVE